MQVVRRMREEGLSVLLIEQNAPLSLSVADRAYVLDDGKDAYAGQAAELAKDIELVNKLAGAGSEMQISSNPSGPTHGPQKPPTARPSPPG